MGARLKGTAVCLAAAAALSACGGGGAPSTQSVRDALGELINARNAQDFKGVCSHLSAEQAKGIAANSGLTCPEALKTLPGATNHITLHIQQVRISGSRATVDATVKQNGNTGQPQTILLVEENGTWKVDSAGL